MTNIKKDFIEKSIVKIKNEFSDPDTFTVKNPETLNSLKNEFVLRFALKLRTVFEFTSLKEIIKVEFPEQYENTLIVFNKLGYTL